jgi:5'-3' exonuclease
VILLDFNQTGISSLMAQGGSTPGSDISLPLVRHIVLNTIRMLNVKFKTEFGKMVICCDNRSYWRKRVFPYYKANRKASRQSSNLDWDTIFYTLNTIRDELNEFFPYPVIDVEGAEADDVIAALTFHAQTLSTSDRMFDEPEPVLILSGDHDFQQLQKFPTVKQYDPVKKAWIVPSKSPRQTLLEHILRGDTGDGIPNFLSDDAVFVTEKARQKSIFKAKMDEWIVQPMSYFENSPEFKQNFIRNRELIDLTRVPEDIQRQVVESYTTQLGTRNKSHLKQFFLSRDMNILFNYISEF